MSYSLLFISAFGAATLLPLYSEVAVIGILQAGADPALVAIIATAGNTLGAVVNWVLGRGVVNFRQQRWFPFSESQLNRATDWFGKYGVWSLLLAWMPIGGDALTFAAGVLKVNFWVFLVLVGIGKGLRYLLVIAAFLNVT